MAQPSKGKRGHINTRAPRPQHDIYRALADDLGLDLGDYSVLVLACVHGLEVPPYIAGKIKARGLDPSTIVEQARSASRGSQVRRDEGRVSA